MNKQRTYIYSRRRHALLGERIEMDLQNMLYDLIENSVKNCFFYSDLEDEMMRSLTIALPFTEDEYTRMSEEDRIDKIYAAAAEARERRNERICEVALPVIKDWVENRGATGRIQVPITDGKRVFRIIVDITEAYKTDCKSIVKEWHKLLLLFSIDELWKEHLRELDQLRQSVQNASYEQKDPLVIYKIESFHLFETMLSQLNSKAMAALMHGQIFVQTPPPSQEGTEQRQVKVDRAIADNKTDYSRYKTSKESVPGENAQRQAASTPQGAPQPKMPTIVGPKVGRNDPCPCGSGKKFKNCHGKGM